MCKIYKMMNSGEFIMSKMVNLFAQKCSVRHIFLFLKPFLKGKILQSESERERPGVNLILITCILRF